jgi:hypothetical protein
MAFVDALPWVDPIVEEVRVARDALAARHDYDVEKLAAAFAERSKASGRKTASPAAAITNGAGQPAVPSTTGTH